MTFEDYRQQLAETVGRGTAACIERSKKSGKEKRTRGEREREGRERSRGANWRVQMRLDRTTMIYYSGDGIRRGTGS